MAWAEEELRRVDEALELELASRRPDGRLRMYITMWVVRAGEELYVRSAGGPDRPWYRRALASGSGRIRAGGVECDVRFASADPGAHEAIDARYRAKYGSFGPESVGLVTGPQARLVTIRLVRSD